jgi:hypothetical protein
MVGDADQPGVNSGVASRWMPDFSSPLTARDLRRVKVFRSSFSKLFWSSCGMRRS